MTVYTYEVDHGEESPKIGADTRCNGGKVTAVCFDAALPKLEKAEEEIENLRSQLKACEQSHADYERKLDEAIKVIEFYVDGGNEHFIGNHAQTFLKSLESDDD